ncbi:MAG: efflux RND transporter periplasmic adaptor subunit [Alphaproteobacteria bacterium]|nr:MAG: efflux RND transporter periplasmic adaptor subunit [Alphaproteobacteria bacterium]
MNSRRILPLIVGALVVAAVGGYVVYGQQQQQEQRTKRGRGAQDQPAPVLAARATIADVPIYLDTVGNTKALNTVTVRAQVGGQIVKVGFKEGQDVTRGFVLAEIDPRTYQAQYDQAVAKKAQDEATLANARIDFDRYTRLAASNSGSKQQADTQKALVAQLEAQVQGDQAAIDNAKTMLSYTKITSPIDGRTGLRLIDEGNLVQANDTSGIVVITQIQPISVLFNLPQQQFPQVNAAFAKGPLEVDAIAGDGRTRIDRGTLQVIDNQMDQTTGTVRMKAEFPNANLQLWPGQFTNIRLLVDTLRQVVVVPTAAVQRGPQGTFVYVIGDDSKVTVRPITVTQQDDTRAVVADGLKAQEQAVTSGFTRLSNGTRVAVQAADGQPQEASPAATPAAPEAGQGRRKREGAEGDGKGRRRSENAPAPDAKQ